MNKGDVIVCIDDSIKDIYISDYFNVTLGSRYIVDSVNKIFGDDNSIIFSVIDVSLVDDSGFISCYDPRRFIELSLYRENIINDILNG